MRFRVPLVTSALILAIAACGERDPVADNAAGENLPTLANDAVPAPAGATSENDIAAASRPDSSTLSTIPAAVQGRWGLTPGDCTSSRGDAKGLLVIDGTELRFYESRAVPSPGIQSDEDSISGNFHFTGEGQTWTKFETLERRKDKLVRTESNPAASYTYAKC